MNKKKIPIIIFSLLIVVGFVIMFYPLIMNLFNKNESKYIISDYTNKISKKNDEDKASILESARKYNESLSSVKVVDSFENNNDIVSGEYLKLLNFDDNGLIGYIKIPKIDIELPIYHGTSNKTLERGIGHFEGSSLPIGGKSTHSILTGHRGLPLNKLFTDLDRLVVDDKFYIYVMDEVLTYSVDDIRVVEPDDLSNLDIVDGEDYVTLITCTPYGLNTHRLLVRGKRLLNDTDLPVIESEPEIELNSSLIYFGIIFISFVVYIVIRRKNNYIL